MSHIVEDLLTLSRLESSNLERHEGEQIDVLMLINSVLNEAKHLGQSIQHQLTTDIDNSIALYAKQMEVYSAVQNLVQNACKYVEPGAKITVSWKTHPLGAALTVTDTGPGIEPNHLPRLSERFYRVDKDRSRDSGGTGLGLAIVKYIVQRHGGQLNIRSTLGEGSEFELLFPSERVLENPTRRVAELPS